MYGLSEESKMNENLKLFYRQGELVFQKVQSVDKAWKLKERSDNVIREGEVSGHMHAVKGKGQLFDVSNRSDVREGTMVLQAQELVQVEHPEHKSLSLDKGSYVVTVQREYSELRNNLVSD